MNARDGPWQVWVRTDGDVDIPTIRTAADVGDEEDIVVLIDSENPKLPYPKLLTTAQIAQEPDSHAPRDTLHISPSLAELLSLSQDQVVPISLSPSRLPARLERIVLTTDDYNAWQWVNSHDNWRTFLQLPYIISAFRPFTAFAADDGRRCVFTPIDCLPVSQGVLAEDSQIVVRYCQDNDDTGGNASECVGDRRCACSGTPIPMQKSKSSAIGSINATDPPILSAFARRFQTSRDDVKLALDSMETLPLRPLSNEDVLSDVGEPLGSDPLAEGIASVDLMTRLNMFHGGYVLLTTSEGIEIPLRLFTCPHNSRCRESPRKARELAVPLYTYESLLGSSPPSSTVVTIRNINCRNPEQLGVASSVTIARLATPESERGDITDSIKDHFSEPKLCWVGQVFVVGVDGNGPKSNVAFKVMNINNVNSSTYGYVSASSTTLYQEASTNDFVPNSVRRLLVPLNDTFESPISQEVENLLQPSLVYTASTFSEVSPSILVFGLPGAGKVTEIRSAAERLGYHFYPINSFDILASGTAETGENLEAVLTLASLSTPCVVCIRNVEGLIPSSQRRVDGVEKQLLSILEKYQKLSHRSRTFPLIITATTSDKDSMHPGLLSLFSHHLKLSAPDDARRKAFLSQILKATPTALDVNAAGVAKISAGLVLRDLQGLVTLAGKSAIKRSLCVKSAVDSSTLSEADVLNSGVVITRKDVDDAAAVLNARMATALGAPKVPDVRWDDIGGMENVKKEVLDTVQLPLQNKAMFAEGLGQRSGILLYGPPGTGKTLVAKAVATECALNFMSVKGPELINSYVGESEKNIRQVFEKAREAKPCVIFFDELDALAPRRGVAGDSGGVMDRIVSQLLSEIDGVGSGCDVFVVAATNRPDLLDQSLLRPGRFDKMVYVGISTDKAHQRSIIQALTRKFHLDDDVDFDAIAAECPPTFTGADLYAMCSDAHMNAITTKVNVLERQLAQIGDEDQRVEFLEEQNERDEKVLVSLDDFRQALRNLTPSLSQSELDKYEKIRQKFSPNQ